MVFKVLMNSDLVEKREVSLTCVCKTLVVLRVVGADYKSSWIESVSDQSSKKMS